MAAWVAPTVVCAIALPLLPFLPLALAALEESLWGSSHVEDLFRTVGLHEPLGKLYSAMEKLLTGR